MLKIVVPETEVYNEATNEFLHTKEIELCLEHSLVSISKWESKWKKPFLGTDAKTFEESVDYIRCMTITQNVPDDVYYCLTKENMDAIGEYIQDSHTATWFNDRGGRPNHEVITSELIYYWMTAFQIPPEYQKWHLNRLLTLIKICSIKNDPKGPKKMSRAAVGHHRRARGARGCAHGRFDRPRAAFEAVREGHVVFRCRGAAVLGGVAHHARHE